MDLCKYSKYAKCTVCTYPIKVNCSKFRSYHCGFLCRELGNFKLVKQQELFDASVWSREEVKIKSLCAQRAIKRNLEVKKYSFNQIVSIALSNEDVEYGVYYVECTTKVLGDVEKMSSVVQSFVDKVLDKGGYVYLFVKAGVVLNLNDIKRL